MKIVIAGGTGFLGTPLVRELINDGHEIVILTRHGHPAASTGSTQYVQWDPASSDRAWRAALSGATAIVNLAGESIAGRRWSAAHKERILQSRLDATRQIVAAIHAMTPVPAALISASAVGYYGSRGDEPLTERSGPGGDFLAQVCVQWEAEAFKAADICRVAVVRTGIVLARDGGALERMLLPFRLFVGGRLGSGRQYMSWIHRSDWVGLVKWLLRDESASGPFNATAPTPVTNEEFASTLGRALHRPSWLPAPSFALRLALGEMADSLLLFSQRALPAHAEDQGFRFAYHNLDRALQEIVT